MYTDDIVIAGFLAVLGTAAVAAGFFLYIWLDSADHPGDEHPDESKKTQD